MMPSWDLVFPQNDSRHGCFFPNNWRSYEKSLRIRCLRPSASLPAAPSEWCSDDHCVQEANKEGKLKLAGAGPLGGTKRMAAYEQLMNKMFGTNLKIGFTPGPSMPAMGSQIATELAAGQTAVSDVYIGAESYLVPLVNRKIFQPVEWQKLLPGRITNPMVEGDGQSLRVFSGLPGTP